MISTGWPDSGRWSRKWSTETWVPIVSRNPFADGLPRWLDRLERLDVEGRVRWWRDVDDAFPKSVEAEEEFDFTGAEEGVHDFHGALAARALERGGTPHAEDAKGKGQSTFLEQVVAANLRFSRAAAPAAGPKSATASHRCGAQCPHLIRWHLLPFTFYHVRARGNRRQEIFADDSDRRFFLRTLGEACGMTGWEVHAWARSFFDTRRARWVS